MDAQQQQFLKVPEVAEGLRIARSRAYELVANGTIPAVKIGRSVRVSRKELERWLEEQRYLDVVGHQLGASTDRYPLVRRQSVCTALDTPQLQPRHGQKEGGNGEELGVPIRDSRAVSREFEGDDK